MDDKAINAIMQGVVLLLQASFQMMAAVGKTEAEIEQTFWETKAAFEKRRPDDLPDV